MRSGWGEWWLVVGWKWVGVQLSYHTNLAVMLVDGEKPEQSMGVRVGVSWMAAGVAGLGESSVEAVLMRWAELLCVLDVYRSPVSAAASICTAMYCSASFPNTPPS